MPFSISILSVFLFFQAGIFPRLYLYILHQLSSKINKYFTTIFHFIVLFLATLLCIKALQA